MAQSGPIVLIDDDQDDHQLLMEVLREIGASNTLHYFPLCTNAFHYLKITAEKPLVILCDINLPQQSGLEFKKQIDADSQLRSKSIPFIFFTTSRDKAAIDTAYKELVVQGFFQKPTGFDQLKTVIQIIMDYWKLCLHPNV